MKSLFAVLLVLLLSVLAALWFSEQGGFVQIHVADWTVETSLILFVGVVLASVFALYLLFGVVARLWRLPRGVRGWFGRRRQNRARRHLIEGMIRAAEGRYAEAEKTLIKDAERSEAPLLHYLVAATVAQRLEALDRRDSYLARADRSSRRARLAVSLIQAQLQIDAGQWEQALASLNYLSDRNPQHPRVLGLLLQCCLALKDWERIGELLPVLRKRGVVDAERGGELEREVALYRLERATRVGDRALRDTWRSLSKQAREQPVLAAVYVDGMLLHGNEAEAESTLQPLLQKHWGPQLVQRYGALREHPDKHLAQLEKWLKQYPEDPVLLYAAARQALRSQLWGRARAYLEASLARQPVPKAYLTLGGLLEQLGEPEKARDCFRKGAELATGQVALAELSDSAKKALASANGGGQP